MLEGVGTAAVEGAGTAVEGVGTVAEGAGIAEEVVDMRRE